MEKWNAKLLFILIIIVLLISIGFFLKNKYQSKEEKIEVGLVNKDYGKKKDKKFVHENEDIISTPYDSSSMETNLNEHPQYKELIESYRKAVTEQ